MLQDREREWLMAVVDNLLDDSVKLAYADWLEEQGDDRATFLRKYVTAARSSDPAVLPLPKKLPEEWLELIGFRIVERCLRHGFPELCEPLLRVARPALRMNKQAAKDSKLAAGASKIGGLPDLPADYPWPKGDDCRAIYNDDTAGVEELAGFVAQVNFAEIADTQAARGLPKSGVLSFFCFQDIENDNPDVIGVQAIYFPDPSRLVRTKPPGELTEGNAITDPRRLRFEQTLDLPEHFDSPWSEELKPDPDADYSEVFGHFRHLNFENFLGYARATSGGDPTPDKQSRQLILVDNPVGCRLHIQLSQQDLEAHNFHAIRLVWVDFD